MTFQKPDRLTATTLAGIFFGLMWGMVLGAGLTKTGPLLAHGNATGDCVRLQTLTPEGMISSAREYCSPTIRVSPKSKFYITGGSKTTDTGQPPRDDCRVPAIVSDGDTKEEALARAGFKVWSAQEYYESKDGIQAACRNRR